MKLKFKRTILIALSLGVCFLMVACAERYGSEGSTEATDNNDINTALSDTVSTDKSTDSNVSIADSGDGQTGVSTDESGEESGHSYDLNDYDYSVVYNAELGKYFMVFDDPTRYSEPFGDREIYFYFDSLLDLKRSIFEGRLGHTTKTAIVWSPGWSEQGYEIPDFNMMHIPILPSECSITKAVWERTTYGVYFKNTQNETGMFLFVSKENYDIMVTQYTSNAAYETSKDDIISGTDIVGTHIYDKNGNLERIAYTIENENGQYIVVKGRINVLILGNIDGVYFFVQTPQSVDFLNEKELLSFTKIGLLENTDNQYGEDGSDTNDYSDQEASYSLIYDDELQKHYIIFDNMHFYSSQNAYKTALSFETVDELRKNILNYELTYEQKNWIVSDSNRDVNRYEIWDLDNMYTPVLPLGHEQLQVRWNGSYYSVDFKNAKDRIYGSVRFLPKELYDAWLEYNSKVIAESEVEKKKIEGTDIEGTFYYHKNCIYEWLEGKPVLLTYTLEKDGRSYTVIKQYGYPNNFDEFISIKLYTEKDGCYYYVSLDRLKEDVTDEYLLSLAEITKCNADVTAGDISMLCDIPDGMEIEFLTFAIPTYEEYLEFIAKGERLPNDFFDYETVSMFGDFAGFWIPLYYVCTSNVFLYRFYCEAGGVISLFVVDEQHTDSIPIPSDIYVNDVSEYVNPQNLWELNEKVTGTYENDGVWYQYSKGKLRNIVWTMSTVRMSFSGLPSSEEIGETNPLHLITNADTAKDTIESIFGKSIADFPPPTQTEGTDNSENSSSDTVLSEDTAQSSDTFQSEDAEQSNDTALSSDTFQSEDAEQSNDTALSSDTTISVDDDNDNKSETPSSKTVVFTVVLGVCLAATLATLAIVLFKKKKAGK